MRLHFLVEGPADVAFLEKVLPRLIPAHSFQLYPHQGRGKLPGKVDTTPDPTRRGLLDNLPAKLRAWGRSFSGETDRVVVLLDLDEGDCAELLARLNRMLKSVTPHPVTLFRLAIEETESWYLGDRSAIRKAFPSAKLRKLDAWKPDSIVGTWEYFMEIIGASSDDKVAWGDAMGATIRVEEPLEPRNASPSFRKFCRRVRELAGEAAPRAPKIGKEGVPLEAPDPSRMGQSPRGSSALSLIPALRKLEGHVQAHRLLRAAREADGLDSIARARGRDVPTTAPPASARPACCRAGRRPCRRGRKRRRGRGWCAGGASPR